MKTLKLIFEFFTNNKITAIIISIIYIFVLFIANNSFGMYRYIVYTSKPPKRQTAFTVCLI